MFSVKRDGFCDIIAVFLLIFKSRLANLGEESYYRYDDDEKMVWGWLITRNKLLSLLVMNLCRDYFFVYCVINESLRRNW